MGEDINSEIDSILSAELPEYPGDRSDVVERREAELIAALQQAAEELDTSPTAREFDALGLDVTSDTIRSAFGTWNEGKRAAGLEAVQRGTVREIDETYFETIDTAEKAYWFGTLLATSSLQKQELGSNYTLNLGRVEYRAYFVTEFARAVGSDYPITVHQQNKSDNQQVQIHISNPTFVGCLLDAGYPHPDEPVGGFPDVDDALLVPFLRGFLESSGYFSTSGWNVSTANAERAESFREWFEDFGAKRPTVSEQADGRMVVRVASVFDIKAVFESLWPSLLDTHPSFEPYPRKVLDHLASEYPYPENVDYLPD